MRDQDGAPLADNSQDYRLPKNVTPKRYDIRLTPDLTAFTFQGEVSVAIVVNDPTDDVVLNALELEIDKVTAERSGKSLSAKAEMEPAKERAHLRFTEKLSAGEWTLKIAFRGILNDKLHGFYRSQYQDAAGKTHVAATTQFESTDARRAFPCWDEPELKASYKVALVVDENLAAISNGGQESERKLAGSKKEVVFKETIAMSTYLVAFIVGEFDATAPVDAGTPLRIVHVPGKESLTGWAQQIGAFSLKYFADYYGLKYPGDKLDLIAIPDFASGAMENLGAITFRETALLADEKTASRAELERVADVVSHENAHMWFGDLVTMRWWNGIWLNEAFATFMEMLAVNAWKPEWKRWESLARGRDVDRRPAQHASDRVRGAQSRRLSRDVRHPDLREGRGRVADARAVPWRQRFSRRHSPVSQEASVRQHRDRRFVGRAGGGVARARAQDDGLVDLPARLSDYRRLADCRRPQAQAFAAPIFLSGRRQRSALACASDGSRED
jgi:puromycin-sensitive aminopeptidase